MTEPQELRTYTYTDNNGTEVTAQLNERDAQRLNAKPVDGADAGSTDAGSTDAKATDAPATKARKAADNK